ncbi:N-acetylmuramoyl-L-alanine amidase [Candidatus Acetothermia bacterium]|nr:N-acetylmuramoyl-L-alanine amidase [Candidatus Acetothermia bacterium]MBI3643492.1 N-acetylmuramoyl-L-alanine amidase [Candidatus Acetothermia bacterium]
MRNRRAFPLAFLGLYVLLSLFTFATTSLSATPAPHWVVVIDAGHGGKDPGATGYQGLLEKDVNLELARIVRFLSLSDPQLEIVLTRYDDRFIELQDRINFAERLDADAYISIHANSDDADETSGVETVMHEAKSSPNYSSSLKLAQAIVKNVVSEMKPSGIRDRGVKQRPLYTRWASMPAVVLETGFVTSPEDANNLTSLWYQLRLAQSILDGIKSYLKSQ